MSLPSSTRSATPATQAQLIHIDLGQHGLGHGQRVRGLQFLHALDDAAATSAAAALVQPVASSSSGGSSLLPGLPVVAVAAAHHYHRAGPGACHAGHRDNATAPHRALFLRPELLGGAGSSGTRPESDALALLDAGAAVLRLSGGAGVRLPASSSSPASASAVRRMSGCTCPDGFFLCAALKEESSLPIESEIEFPLVLFFYFLPIFLVSIESKPF